MAQAYVYEDDSVGWRHMLAGDVPSGGGSPLTTKGDVYGFSSVNARIPIGADGTVLTADSTQTLGLKWGTGASGTISDLTSTGGSLTITAPTGPTTNADVATSGVTAATYGDATHVGQFHVGADGRVTSASSIAISGSGGAGGLISLYDSSYLGASAATIDTGVNGVASGHFCIIVVAYLRCDTAATEDTVQMNFNNDSTSLYAINRLRNSNASVSGASTAGTTTTAQIAFVPAASAAANVFGGFYMHCPAYDGSSNHKAGYVQSYGSQDTTSADQVGYSFLYKSTTAISRIAIAPQTGGAKFVAGSRMVVYGLQ